MTYASDNAQYQGPKMNELISLEKIAQWQKLKTLVLDSVSSPITKRDRDGRAGYR
jgi:hypothetical protein